MEKKNTNLSEKIKPLDLKRISDWAPLKRER